MGGIVMFYTINIQKPILTDMFLVITNSPVEFPGMWFSSQARVLELACARKGKIILQLAYRF